MKEIWRDIPTTKNYQASNMGRIRHHNKIITLSTSNEGYLTASLRYHGKSKTRYVHRLVAQTFIPNPKNLPAVNHKDEDKQNDQVNNLEWCTIKYNDRYGNHMWKQARSRFYSVKITRGKLSRIFPSMASANYWLRAYGNVRKSKYTIRDQLRRCCWGQVQNVFGYQARFVIKKGSSWQTSLFDKPHQTSLFGKD